MSATERYRAEGVKYRKLLDAPNSPTKAIEFRNLEQTFQTLADMKNGWRGTSTKSYKDLKKISHER